MTLRHYLLTKHPTIEYSYASGDVYTCTSPGEAITAMKEICEYYENDSKEALNTGTYLVLDDESEVYKIVVRDI